MMLQVYGYNIEYILNCTYVTSYPCCDFNIAWSSESDK